MKAFFLGVTAIDGVCGVVDSFKPQTPEMIAATAFFSLTAFIAFAAFAIIRAIEKAGIK